MEMFRTRAFLAAVVLVATGAAATGYKPVYRFAGTPDGGNPEAALTATKSALYGTTFVGGSGNFGAVIALDPKTGIEHVVYAFKGDSDGANPNAPLLDVGGTLYGTTYAGGTTGAGTVYGLDPKTGAEHVVYAFSGGSDGSAPLAGVTRVGARLFGTTRSGGTAGLGTVYSVDGKTGAEKVVYSFGGGRDGVNPASGLTEFGGLLYGTTTGGGDGSVGTVFSIDPKSGAEKVVYSFAGGKDGADPTAGLTLAGGLLYGTTYAGGAGGCGNVGCGTVFSLDPGTGTERTLYAFAGGGSDGSGPSGALFETKGTLLGTTLAGGNGCSTSGCGTIFSVRTKTGSETVLRFFRGGKDGANPEAGLVPSGKYFYGTTTYGGVQHCEGGCGIIYRIVP